jgi:hypothetical protein
MFNHRRAVRGLSDGLNPTLRDFIYDAEQCNLCRRDNLGKRSDWNKPGKSQGTAIERSCRSAAELKMARSDQTIGKIA